MKFSNLIFLVILSLGFFACESDDDNGGGLDPDLNDPVELSGTQSSPLQMENLFSDPVLPDYIVDGTFRIDAPVTVEPGVRILMKPGSRIDIQSGGSLSAIGTDDQPIYFVGEQQARGFWDYIMFQSNNPNNRLEHCYIAFGGGSSLSSGDGAVVIRDNAQLAIHNTVITESGNNGLFLTSNNSRLSSFQENVISNCTKYPISLRTKHLDAIDGTTEFTTGNGFNQIEVEGNSVDLPLTIQAAAGPYLFTGTSRFKAATEIMPGTSIEVGPNGRILVESTGSLSIIGNVQDRISISGAEEAKGYWDYLYFDGTLSPNNQIKYTDISYGGGSSLSCCSGALSLRNSFVSMEESSVTQSMRYGVKVPSNSTFEDLGGNFFQGNELGDFDN